MPNNDRKPSTPWLFLGDGMPRVCCSQHSCSRHEPLFCYAPAVSTATRGMNRREEFDAALAKLTDILDSPWTPLEQIQETTLYAKLKDVIDDKRVRNCTVCRDTHKLLGRACGGRACSRRRHRARGSLRQAQGDRAPL